MPAKSKYLCGLPLGLRAYERKNDGENECSIGANCIQPAPHVALYFRHCATKGLRNNRNKTASFSEWHINAIAELSLEACQCKSKAQVVIEVHLPNNLDFNSLIISGPYCAADAPGLKES